MGDRCGFMWMRNPTHCSREKGHSGNHEGRIRRWKPSRKPQGKGRWESSPVEGPAVEQAPTSIPEHTQVDITEEQPEPMAYPDDITTRWLEYISSVKHTARAKGEKSPIHHLTSVESILQWWEEDIRPTLFTHPPVRKARDEPA